MIEKRADEEGGEAAIAETGNDERLDMRLFSVTPQEFLDACDVIKKGEEFAQLKRLLINGFTALAVWNVAMALALIYLIIKS